VIFSLSSRSPRGGPATRAAPGRRTVELGGPPIPGAKVGLSVSVRVFGTRYRTGVSAVPSADPART
jgi:hypothetical protein